MPPHERDSACRTEPQPQRRQRHRCTHPRHESYRISQRKRKRIEECFGWLKTIALLRKVRHRGLEKVDWVFAFACAAYNLVRLRNLTVQLA